MCLLYEEEIPLAEEVPVESEELRDEDVIEPEIGKTLVKYHKVLQGEKEFSGPCEEVKEYSVSAEGAKFVGTICEKEPSSVSVIQEEVIALSEGVSPIIASSPSQEETILSLEEQPGQQTVREQI